MDRLHVSVVCLLLEMTAEPTRALADCPPCAEGYFLVKTCSVSNGRRVSVQCQPCTNCSAVYQETLVPCSSLTDAVCGNITTTSPTATSAGAPVPSGSLFLLPVISASVLTVILLSLFLAFLSCRKPQSYKGNKLLPPITKRQEKPLPSGDTPVFSAGLP